MRISAAQRVQNENRIRAAMDRLLRGEIPPGGDCDIKTLASQAGVDRTAFYGNRPYAHLRTEFEDRLQQLQNSGQTPDPKTAQIERLKPRSTSSEPVWHKRIPRSTNSPTSEPRRSRDSPPNTKRSSGSARPPTPNTNITRLPAARQKIIGPC